VAPPSVGRDLKEALPLDDLHKLPKLRDSLSSLYVEHAKIDRHEKSIAIHNADGVTPIPAANLAVLMLGPGTKVTQAAVAALADNNCLVIWCGEENVRFYAFGTGGARGASAIIHQAALVSDEEKRLEVVKRMYIMRFREQLGEHLTVNTLRGMEGARVRDAYARLSRETGVEWTGRNYDRSSWASADPVNRALSCANACLYGICHAGILSAGYSPALGFIHTGKQLSFVYDIADLYKIEIALPVAFASARQNPPDLERTVRLSLRDTFRETRLLQRIIPDIQKALATPNGIENLDEPLEDDPARPTDLWTPEREKGTEGT